MHISENLLIFFFTFEKKSTSFIYGKETHNHDDELYENHNVETEKKLILFQVCVYMDFWRRSAGLENL